MKMIVDQQANYQRLLANQRKDALSGTTIGGPIPIKSVKAKNAAGSKNL